MKIISNGETMTLPPRGPAGPDGNPIGTVISYLGMTAPKDYLVCDGAAYPVSEYPELAGFFQAQFGAVNYFGGDGTNNFSVPDMRNLFLRGYYGGGDDRLSGEIGKRQAATEIPAITTGTNPSNESIFWANLNKRFASSDEIKTIVNADTQQSLPGPFGWGYVR